MVHVQAILFASLSVSLISAFLAMVGKQWLNRYASADMQGSAVERGRNRQRKLDGIVAWYFNHVMELLPLMLQAALLLLGCALSRYLWGISITVASVIIGVTSLGLILYLFITLAGAAFENCPYQTPGSHILRYLGPKAWRRIRSVPSVIGPALRKLSEESKVIRTIASSVKAHDPWWSRSQIIPFFGRLVLKVPLGLAVDFYHLGPATMRELIALPFEAYHLANSWLYSMHSFLKRLLDQHTTPSDFRCISWTLQTSLDKADRMTASEHLVTMTELTGMDPTLVADCFNVFVGCVSFSNGRLVVMQGLEQLSVVSAGCLFRTSRHLSVTDPTSSVLVDLRRRYDRVFPFDTDFRGLPFYHTITMIHALVHYRWSLQQCDYRWSGQEHIPFAPDMVEVAQVEYRHMQRRKVPRWILRFALHSLSLDPPPPASVVADCLTIIAIDLDYDVSNVTTSGQRCVQTR